MSISDDHVGDNVPIRLRKFQFGERLGVLSIAFMDTTDSRNSRAGVISVARHKRIGLISSKLEMVSSRQYETCYR